MIIKIDSKIKKEIAEKFLIENSAGYSFQHQGAYYLVDGSQIMHMQANAPWTPWHDSASVISLDYLINEIGGAQKEGVDFSDGDDMADDSDEKDDAIFFVLGYIPDQYDQDEIDNWDI